MAIKKLQNDHTSPEQSKRLLELGVPAWTANIMFDKNRRRYELIETEDESLAETQRTLFYNGGAIPHWSAGRLMEICKKCETKEDYEQLCDELKECRNYCELIISHIDVRKILLIIDFSKLEE